MRPEEEAALADIHAAFSGSVAYTGAGLIGAAIAAVRMEDTAPPFQGAGATLRKVWYEIMQDVLPSEPRKGDQIVDGGAERKVIDVTRRDDLAAWWVVVQK
ncbi:hypothetical protein [Sphingobium agri]|uniref:Uncharacterized protein n=1 Tax=Sphingobium agri TaxID=2933566 RepID=A0ABT0E1Z8_9SPHN|nr:hypothetical protein [Sphingobium agri]MCK0533406.1 hypothetical protein [Sphingobium agri]